MSSQCIQVGDLRVSNFTTASSLSSVKRPFLYILLIPTMLLVKNEPWKMHKYYSNHEPFCYVQYNHVLGSNCYQINVNRTCSRQ